MPKKISEYRKKKLKKLFIDVYRTHGVLGRAALTIGVSRQLVHEWRKEDPAFEQAVIEAYEDAVDEAEVELRKRAIDGVEEPLLYKGQPIYKRDPETSEIICDANGQPIVLTVPRRSDRLLEVYTRTHRPQYKDKSEVSVTGPGGGALDSRILIEFVKSNGDGLPEDSK
jgi:hypothetical protein